MLVRRGLANWSCAATRLKQGLGNFHLGEYLELRLGTQNINRTFSSTVTSSPRKVDEVVQKYARFHVNPDQYDIKPTRAVPDSIERPMWLRPNLPKKFDNYEGLTTVTDPKEVKSSRFLTKNLGLQLKSHLKLLSTL